MPTETAHRHDRLDHLDTLIENHPHLLDEAFDQDRDDLERAFEDLRDRIGH